MAYRSRGGSSSRRGSGRRRSSVRRAPARRTARVSSRRRASSGSRTIRIVVEQPQAAAGATLPPEALGYTLKPARHAKF